MNPVQDPIYPAITWGIPVVLIVVAVVLIIIALSSKDEEEYFPTHQPEEIP